MNERDEPLESDGQPTAEVEVEQLTKERDEYLGRWQRAQADYQNLRRRTQSDIDNAVRRSTEGLLQGLLLVLDHLELALAAPNESADAQTLASGVRLTRDSLLQTLRKEGVETIPESSAFDPHLHEAVATVETDDAEAGTVVDVLRRGYTWNGQVLRAAHVRVARAPHSS